MKIVFLKNTLLLQEKINVFYCVKNEEKWKSNSIEQDFNFLFRFIVLFSIFFSHTTYQIQIATSFLGYSFFYDDFFYKYHFKRTETGNESIFLKQTSCYCALWWAVHNNHS